MIVYTKLNGSVIIVIQLLMYSSWAGYVIWRKKNVELKIRNDNGD